jgi:alpha-tubulin suppressor-like RCC1 family protein
VKRWLFLMLGAVLVCVQSTLAGELTAAWGSNDRTQLGLGSSFPQDYVLDPHRVREEAWPYPSLTNVASLAGGGLHSLALMTNGTVMAWGAGDFGQLAQGLSDLNDKDAAVPISGLAGVDAVACGGNHSIALMADNTLMAWGDNASGQLGLGDTLPPIPLRAVPDDVVGVNDAQQIACGYNFTLVLLNNGQVMAFGNNAFNQLGFDGDVRVSTPTLIPGLTNVAAISAGNAHSAAVLNDGTVKVWGRNGFGQLGVGNTNNCSTPTTVPGLSGVSDVACGGYHTLFLMNDQTVKSCGMNVVGQLGLGDFTNRTLPETISGLTDVAQIQAGSYFSAARLDDTSVKAWGNYLYGLTEDPEILLYTKKVPDSVVGLRGVSSIAAGSYHVLSHGVEVPVLSVPLAYLDFGYVAVGDQKTLAFPVSNIGFGDLTLTVTVDAPFYVGTHANPLVEDVQYFVPIRFQPVTVGLFSNQVVFAGGYQDEIRYVKGHSWTEYYTLRWTSSSNAIYRVVQSDAPQAGYNTVIWDNVIATPPTNSVDWQSMSPFTKTTVFWRVEGTTGAVPSIVFMGHVVVD